MPRDHLLKIVNYWPIGLNLNIVPRNSTQGHNTDPVSDAALQRPIKQLDQSSDLKCSRAPDK